MPTSEIAAGLGFLVMAIFAMGLSGYTAYEGFFRWPTDRDTFLWLLPLLLMAIAVVAFLLSVQTLRSV